MKSRLLQAFLVALIAQAATAAPLTSKDMPGRSFQGPLPPASARQKKLATSLKADVTQLAVTIGERNVGHYAKLQQTRQWIKQQLQAAGYSVHEQTYKADNHEFANLECQREGASKDLLVVGAHYDSVAGCPGANDNGSGVAALLALARELNSYPGKLSKTVRFVAFTNEEPEYFQTKNMGSLVYARFCRQRKDPIKAMISLETLGFYSDVPDSQHYPPPLGLAYPSTGNFVAFVGNLESAPLVKSCIASFRKHASFPSEGGALPGALPGVGWSDHWSFWDIGVPGLEVTDTAPFRYQHYHLRSDTPDKLNFERFARVVAGLGPMLIDLAK